jgi:D-3-phosphoglycerate dehydrogenase
LINTARGSVVVENDLAVALQSGQLAGAALDVFAGEPPEPGSLLLRLPQVLLSPHSAGISTDSLRRIGLQAAEQVRRVLCDAPPDHLINPQVWDIRRR